MVVSKQLDSDSHPALSSRHAAPGPVGCARDPASRDDPRTRAAGHFREDPDRAGFLARLVALVEAGAYAVYSWALPGPVRPDSSLLERAAPGSVYDILPGQGDRTGYGHGDPQEERYSVN
jgi:hypothetical protein